MSEGGKGGRSEEGRGGVTMKKRKKKKEVKGKAIGMKWDEEKNEEKKKVQLQ